MVDINICICHWLKSFYNFYSSLLNNPEIILLLSVKNNEKYLRIILDVNYFLKKVFIFNYNSQTYDRILSIFEPYRSSLLDRNVLKDFFLAYFNEMIPRTVIINL